MNHSIDLSSSNAWDDSALTASWNEALREYKVGNSTSLPHIQLTDDRSTTAFMPKVKALTKS
jgi:hypothetical protein